MKITQQVFTKRKKFGDAFEKYVETMIIVKILSNNFHQVQFEADGKRFVWINHGTIPKIL
jgi:hypothetical protein